MRSGRWLIFLAVVAVLGSLPTSAVVLAATPDEPAEPADPADGEFERIVGKKVDDTAGDDGSDTGGSGSDTDGGSSGSGSGSDGPVKVPCLWSDAPTTQADVDIFNVVYDVLDPLFDVLTSGNSLTFESQFYMEYGTLRQWNAVDAEFQRYQLANCATATQLTVVETRGWRWRRVDPPSPTILVPPVTLLVKGRIQPPQPAINPPGRAAINLGLWLAVGNSEPIVVQGSLGPLWARGTATLTSTTFDPGNGDVVPPCFGGGTPIPDSALDSVAPGPCGYVYRSLDDVRNDHLEITIASTWTITWVTSDGTGNPDPPETMTLRTVVPYDVYEVQTVGN